LWNPAVAAPAYTDLAQPFGKLVHWERGPFLRNRAISRLLIYYMINDDLGYIYCTTQ
jgi:hypothetical protein